MNTNQIINIVEKTTIAELFEEAGLKRYTQTKGLADRVIEFIPNQDSLGVMSCKVIGVSCNVIKGGFYLTIHPVVFANSQDLVQGEVLGYTSGTGWYLLAYKRLSAEKPIHICGQIHLDY